MIDLLKSIEAKAYPYYMQMIQYAENEQDLADYCECSVEQLGYKLCNDNKAYIIWSKKGNVVEIVDIAGDFGSSLRSELLNTLTGAKKIVLDAREDTSYRLIKPMAKRYGFRIKKDRQWEWGDHIMHEMVLRKEVK